MRKILSAAGLAACLSLAACSEKPAAPAPEAAAAPKKSMARQASMYAGQEQVQSIERGTITVAEGGGVNLSAEVTTDGAGWTQVGFLPRVYPATPPDGIYEVDVVAQKPASPGAAGPTKVEAKGGWDKYKDGRVKGVTFITKTNQITVKLAG